MEHNHWQNKDSVVTLIQRATHMEELEKLSSQLISQFRTDGVVVIRQCVSDKWLEALAEAVEADIASPGPFFHGYQSGNRQGHFHGNLRLWEHDATFREFCFTSLLPELATQPSGISKD